MSEQKRTPGIVDELADGDTRSDTERKVDEAARKVHRIAKKGARFFDAGRSLLSELGDFLEDMPTDGRGPPPER